MQLIYGLPRGNRIKRYFDSITNDSDLWWCYEDEKWKPLKECYGAASSNYGPVRTEKAFLRHLRKHPELKGSKVLLVSKYYDPKGEFDYNIIVDWEEG